MKYYKLAYTTNNKIIGSNYPQCINVLDDFKKDTTKTAERIVAYQDRPIAETEHFTLKGLIVKSNVLTDFISSTIVRNNTFLISQCFFKKFLDSGYSTKKPINLLNSTVSVIWKDDKWDYKIMRVLPIDYEFYVDFGRSNFYAGIGGLGDEIGFKSYEDFVTKNENDIRWSMVFGKVIKFKRKLDLDIFQLGKISRTTFVSENFKAWYISNEFTGLEFKEVGDEECIVCA